jgi:toluene monooxygenase system ferredoxin subunit
VAEDRADPASPVGGRGAWRETLRLDELWEGEIVGVHLKEGDVLLVNLGAGEIRAYDNRCPHAGSRLSEGRLISTTLQCATHLWEFDVRTGDGVNPRNCKLRRYPVRIVDGVILIRIEPTR